MYQTYRTKACFFVVYIREAHPGQNLPDVDGSKRRFMKTTNLDERAEAANACLNRPNTTMIRVKLVTITSKAGANDTTVMTATHLSVLDRPAGVCMSGKVLAISSGAEVGWSPKATDAIAGSIAATMTQRTIMSCPSCSTNAIASCRLRP